MLKYSYILLLLIFFKPVQLESQTISPHIEQYTLQPGSWLPVQSHPDTALSFSYYHHPLYEIDPFWSDLGNTATPAVSLRFGALNFPLSKLLSGYIPYIQRDNPITWIDGRKPFSLLNYNSGGTQDKNGQTIKALYARQMAPGQYLTGLIRYYKSDGHYQKQQSSSTAALINYVILKDHYKLYAGIENHSFSLQENGGLIQDEDLINSFNSSAYLPVNLSSAQSKAKFTTLRGTQFFDLTHWAVKDKADSTQRIAYRKILPVKIIHTFDYESVYRIYTDADPQGGFYRNVFLDEASTGDSLRITSIKNRFEALADSVYLGNLPVSITAGLEPIWQRFYCDSSFINLFGMNISGSLSFGWVGNPVTVKAFYNPVGYYSGDYHLSVDFLHQSKRDSTSDFSLALHIIGFEADPFMQSFTSNHFRWDNQFQKQQLMSFEGKWNWSRIKSGIRGKISLINNYVLFNPEAIPIQLSDPVMVAEIEASKKFIAGPFHADVSLLLQKSSDGQIPLPLLAAHSDIYMHHDIKFVKTNGLLELEYGVDLKYWTSYQGYAYMPATGIFYLQDQVSLGNYPILDLFAQIKIKRTRLFVEWNHTLGYFFEGSYFSTVHYPFPIPHLKYGIYWHFYD